MRAFIRFVLAVFIGVAGTLAWQSYGDVARQMAAAWVPQLAWLLSPPLASSSTTAEQPGPPAVQAAAPDTASARTTSLPPTGSDAATSGPTVSPEFMQRIETMARDLATARQGVAQLTASQEQMAGDIAKLQASEQDILHKLSALPARPATTAAPRPAPTTQPSRAAPSLSSAPLPPPQRSTAPPPR